MTGQINVFALLKAQNDNVTALKHAQETKGKINVANKKEINLPCVHRLDFYMLLIDIE